MTGVAGRRARRPGADVTRGRHAARGGCGIALGLLALGLVALAGPAGASSVLDFVSFDGIDYIRWAEEPGRPLTPADLGPEFAVVGCSVGEDPRGCAYGIDASAAFMPAGTRMYAVRGYATEFRLVAVWRERIFLYQAWRNPRAKTGGDLYDIAGKVRAIDVQRGEPAAGVGGRAATVTSAAEVAALVDLVVRGAVGRPRAHAPGEPRYWITFWLHDGTTLGRPFFSETREVLGGLVVSEEFARILARRLPE